MSHTTLLRPMSSSASAMSRAAATGENRWAAVHRTDAARLVRLGIEHAPAGSVLHAVGEEGIAMRDIAEAISRRFELPATSISPDEAGDIICEAIRSKPKQINTRLGTFGEVLYAVAPKAVDQILHMAYKVFPDSAAARGEKDPNEKASMEQIAMANIMRGVHW